MSLWKGKLKSIECYVKETHENFNRFNEEFKRFAVEFLTNIKEDQDEIKGEDKRKKCKKKKYR
jgi:hypothetical protein